MNDLFPCHFLLSTKNNIYMKERKKEKENKTTTVIFIFGCDFYLIYSKKNP